MIQLIQIADEQGTSTDIVRLVGLDSQPLIPLFTYLMSEKDGERFLLQTSTPNRNLSRFSPSPFDVLSLTQMLVLLEDRGYSAESLISQIRFYEANVIAQIDQHGTPSTPVIRPSTGAVASPANAEQVINFLKLPDASDVNFRIGRVAHSGDVEIPIAINQEILRHHILVAGSTGSGKSNLLSNIAHVADNMGQCIILFDHKPDHQHHHNENSDPRVQNPRAFSNVRYWTFNPQDPNPDAQLIRTRAQELPAELLAATIFHRPGEELQAENFSAIIDAYSQDHETWTIHELRTFVLQQNNHMINSMLGENFQVEQRTMGAIRRKLRFSHNRIPSFIDPTPPTDVFGTPRREIADVDQIFEPGLNVIRIEEGDARGYALFLSHVLRTANNLRANPNPNQELAPHMLVLIDEAAYIFTDESPYLSRIATGELNSRIRMGRSLHISYVIAVQDAGSVPETTRQNLNTTIIGRHRHLNVLREAMPSAARDMLNNADKLAPGEMLVDLFGIASILHVQADHSRSQLTFTD